MNTRASPRPFDPRAMHGSSRWAEELPANRPVVVCCVYGHEVGRATAVRLRVAGIDARILEGGIDGWINAARPVVEKTTG